MQNQTRNFIIVALLALLVVITCWKQSPGEGEPAKAVAVPQEYLVTRLAGHEDHTTSSMNNFAKDRWEVCSTYNYNDSAYCVLRRPKVAK